VKDFYHLPKPGNSIF